MKLELELVPQTAFYTNIRKAMKETEWKKISKAVRVKYNNSCNICNAVEAKYKKYYMHCHEVWEFNIITKEQVLIRLESLCPECHAVKHYGHSLMIGISERELLNHIVKVNSCTLTQAKDMVVAKYVDWKLKSTYNYKFNLDKTLEKVNELIR